MKSVCVSRINDPPIVDVFSFAKAESTFLTKQKLWSKPRMLFAKAFSLQVDFPSGLFTSAIERHDKQEMRWQKKKAQGVCHQRGMWGSLE